MVSASVLVLARLVFEFAADLATLVPELLPTVLMLLRTKAREVIKSVLGFVKVSCCHEANFFEISRIDK
jgi:ribosomal RNA-processing protein 12